MFRILAACIFLLAMSNHSAHAADSMNGLNDKTNKNLDQIMDIQKRLSTSPAYNTWPGRTDLPKLQDDLLKNYKTDQERDDRAEWMLGKMRAVEQKYNQYKADHPDGVDMFENAEQGRQRDNAIPLPSACSWGGSCG